MKRYNILYATSGIQEIQDVCHIKRYKMHAMPGNIIRIWRAIYMPHQYRRYIACHIRKYRNYATSRNTGCAPYQKILYMCDEQYIRNTGRDNTLCAISGSTGRMPNQKTENVRYNRKYYICMENNMCATSIYPICCMPRQEIQKVCPNRRQGLCAISLITIYMCVRCVAILFVKFNIRNANRARATAPISWNNRNFLKWEIVPSRSGLEPTNARLHAIGMWHLLIHGLWYWLWQYTYFVCKYQELELIRNRANSACTGPAMAQFLASQNGH